MYTVTVTVAIIILLISTADTSSHFNPLQLYCGIKSQMRLKTLVYGILDTFQV